MCDHCILPKQAKPGTSISVKKDADFKEDFICTAYSTISYIVPGNMIQV